MFVQSYLACTKCLYSMKPSELVRGKASKSAARCHCPKCDGWDFEEIGTNLHNALQERYKREGEE